MRKQLLKLEEQILPMKESIKKIVVLQRKVCGNFFDQYAEISSKDIESVALMLWKSKDYAVYSDIVLEYVIRLNEIIQTVDTLTHELLVAQERGVIA